MAVCHSQSGFSGETFNKREPGEPFPWWWDETWWYEDIQKYGEISTASSTVRVDYFGLNHRVPEMDNASVASNDVPVVRESSEGHSQTPRYVIMKEFARPGALREEFEIRAYYIKRHENQYADVYLKYLNEVKDLHYWVTREDHSCSEDDWIQTLFMTLPQTRIWRNGLDDITLRYPTANFPEMVEALKHFVLAKFP